MTGQPVPGTWKIRPETEARRAQFSKAPGMPTEAYIVKSRGYPGRHHFYWIGLSRRKGVWYREEAQFNAEKMRIGDYGIGLAEPPEVEGMLAEIDRRAADKGLTRADVNLIQAVKD